MKMILASMALLLSTSAFASGAVAYKCIGRDALTSSSISFDLLFSDSAPGEGYTNESITITGRSWETLELKNQTIYQMHKANKRNNCKVVDGQIMLKTNLKMTPSKEVEGYTVEVKSSCVGAALDVKAVCVFQ